MKENEAFVILDKILEGKHPDELTDHEMLMMFKKEVRGLANPLLVKKYIEKYRHSKKPSHLVPGWELEYKDIP